MKELSIDYRYLKAFKVTARHLNFSKAAIELGVAQSAVSRQIKLLEESVGRQLIIRSSKKVILTEKGIALLQLLENFESDIQSVFFGQYQKTIRIGILHGLLENWFNDVLQEYTKSQQHQLVIEVQPMEKLKEKLISGAYDIIFTTENIQSELISSLKLFEEKLVMISKGEINPKEAWEYPWIVYNENDNLMHMYKKRSKQVIAVNSITAIVSLVKKGVGLAVVPDHLLRSNENLKVYDLKGTPKTQIHLSTLNYQSLPETLKPLIELIKKRSN